MAGIRFAHDGDTETIAGFIRVLAAYEKLSDACVVDTETLRENLFGTRRYAEVLLYEDAGGAVGFALFFHSFSTFLGQPGLYLEDLFVDPAHRGRGFGKALFKRLAEIAVARRCGRLEWSVLDWNTPAIDFYRALGARQMSEWAPFRLDGPQLASLAGA